MAQERQEGQQQEGIGLQLGDFSSDHHYLIFKIGGELYAIEILLVQEIIRYEEPTKISNTNPAIRGVINFRERVIPIIDMNRKFNFPEQEYDAFNVVIILETEKKLMGIVVDEVSDMMTFEPHQIQDVDSEFADDIKTQHLKGMARQGKQIIQILDPLRVLSFQELKEVRDINKRQEEIKGDL